MKNTSIKGVRSGSLVAIKYSGRKHNRSVWLCKCDCGNECFSYYTEINKGTKKYCSSNCLCRNDLRYKQFGDLTVIGFERKSSKRLWRCKCVCGKEKLYRTNQLTKNNITNCGCKRPILVKHGYYYHPLYKIWNGMKKRCYYKNSDSYKYYGARGIEVCNEWKSNPEVFIKWALQNGWKEGFSIERIDVDKNYEPSNVKWIPLSRQSRNKRNSHWISYNGETKCLADWCDQYNLDYRLVNTRLRRGWNTEKAFFQKKHQNTKGKN